jgi:peptidoglycan/LPS O-acetylase OafA/YrhL
MAQPILKDEATSNPVVRPAPKDYTGENGWAILGGLRFVLALIVLLGHATDFAGRAGRVSWTRVGNTLSPTAAVVAFLLISGYSMAHSIENPKGFYLRRFWRIVPLYVFGLIFGYAVIVAAGGKIFMPGRQYAETPDSFSLIANFLFLQGWIVQRLMFNAPLWSISIEIFFYLLAPIFARFRLRLLVVLILISAIVFCTVQPDYWKPYWGGGMLQLAWPWVAGFVLYRNRDELPRLMIVGLCCVLTVAKLENAAAGTATISVLIICSAPLIPLSRFVQNVLNYLGELSYPLYVIHWPTILGIYALYNIRNSTAWIAGSLVMAFLAYHAVDQPIRRRRRRKTVHRVIPPAVSSVAQPTSAV